jgi:hypothetical protein
VSGGIDAARENKIVDTAASALQPRQKTASCVSGNFKLDRAPGLLLNHHGSGADGWPCDQGADLDFYQVTSAQLAVDRKIKKSSISHSPFSVEKEADRPYLADLEGALSAYLSAGVPSRPSCGSRIIL